VIISVWGGGGGGGGVGKKKSPSSKPQATETSDIGGGLLVGGCGFPGTQGHLHDGDKETGVIDTQLLHILEKKKKRPTGSALIFYKLGALPRIKGGGGAFFHVFLTMKMERAFFSTIPQSIWRV